MPWVVAGAAIAGAAVQMYGQYKAGEAAEEQGETQAAWDEYNAKLAGREAVEAQTAAAAEERKFRKAGARKKARLRTQIGQAGILPIGSAELIGEGLASEIEEDALNIRRGGQVGYQRYTAEAALSRFAGRSALLRGRAAKRASRWSMAATGLGGAAQSIYAYKTLT